LSIRVRSPENVIALTQDRMKQHNDKEIWNVLTEATVLSIGVVLESQLVASHVPFNDIPLYAQVSSLPTANVQTLDSLDECL